MAMRRPSPDPARVCLFEARQQWTRTVTRSLEEVIAAIGRSTEQGSAEPFRQLLSLPPQALVNTGASKGHSRRTRACLQRIDRGVDVNASRQRAAVPLTTQITSLHHRRISCSRFGASLEQPSV